MASQRKKITGPVRTVQTDKKQVSKFGLSAFSVNRQCLFLFIIVILVNINTLTLDYAMDDSLLITQNQITQKGIKGIPEIWTNDLFLGYFGKSGVETGGRYRPMSQTLFALQVQFFGSDPVVGHFFNILFYAFTCILLFILIRKLFPTDEKNSILFSFPFLAGLLYALHPLHVEAVANIKSLDEILAMLFSVISAILIIQSFNQRKILNIVLGSFAFFLALASKENAITFLAVIPLTLFYLKKNARQILIAISPVIFITGLYFIIRKTAMGPTQEIIWVDNFLTNPFFGAGFFEKIATVMITWLNYLKLMVIPYPLTTDYYPGMIPVTGWINPLAWVSAFFFLGIAVYALLKLPGRNKAAFGILYFFITFSAVSNLFVNMGTPMNDRFLFMPLAGFCIVIAYLLSDRLPAILPSSMQKNVLKYLIVFICACFALLTFSRNLDWKDDFTLFNHDIQISGNSARCNVMTGKLYYERAVNISDSIKNKEYNEIASVYLRNGLKIYNRYFLAWGLLGVIEMDKHNYRQSLEYFTKCLEIEPDQSVALANLNFIGRKMLEKNDAEGCIKSFRRLKHFSPSKPDSYIVLAEVFSKTGKVDSALILLDQLIKMNEKNAIAWRMKGYITGNILKEEGMAEAFYLKSFSLDPNDYTVLDNLGVIAFHKKNYEKALGYFTNALSIKPNDAHSLRNIAFTYKAMGNLVKMNEYLGRLK